MPRANGNGNGNGSGAYSASQPIPPAKALVVTDATNTVSMPFPQTRLVRRREPFPAYAGMLLFMAVWLVALLIGFGAAGVYQGLQDRTRLAVASSLQHKEQAKGYIDQGNIELALEELSYARQLNPNDAEIADLMAALEVTPAASQPRPTPRPLVTPNATTVSQQDVLDGVMADARSAYAAKDYEKTVSDLEGLRRVEPDYHKSDVEDMLYNSYVNLARQYLSQERWEEAVQQFDKALAIRKNDDVALERYLAATYEAGVTSWDADWKRAVDSFAEIVKIDPTYLDSRTRLYQALVSYGDYMMTQGGPCQAADAYAQAIAMGSTSDLTGKQAQATAACSTAATAPNSSGVPQPTSTRGGGPTPVPSPSGSGKYSVQIVPSMQGTNDDTASIRGRVADKQSHPIVRIEMVVTSTTKKYQRVETTDDYGFFGFDGLDPDTYTVRVSSDPQSVSAPIYVGRKQRALINFTVN